MQTFSASAVMVLIVFQFLEADDETFVKVPIRNRYDALTRLNGEENLASDAEKKKSEVDKRQNKITENANHKQRPTPLERLMRMKIRSEATSLLIGDSVTHGAPKQILYYDKLHPSDRGVRSLEWNIRNAGRPRASSNEDRLSPHQDETLHHLEKQV
nr:hypothetical protein BaRGS_012543 [Batillaria attramentaria]